jgi:glycosyltransferase involved in cell wall biosynthesis
MNIYYLNDTWPWFDKHQCYGRLIHYIEQIHPQVKAFSVKYDPLSRLIGRVYSLNNGWPDRHDSVFAAAEFRFARSCLNKIDAAGICHILFFDNHYRMFRRWNEAPRNIIGTIHHPIGRKYPRLMEENLKRVSSAIVMYRDGVEYFEKYIGKGRVKFIPYGVDTDFFHPAHDINSGPRRLFFTGQNGRNLNMLKRVILNLSKKYKDLIFDLLVPGSIKNNELKELSGLQQVKWYADISENKVRQLYQGSYLLLMPVENSGVNTAIVEALACGLPIVTSDVGGIRDYGGGSVYSVIASEDDDAMVELVERYLNSESLRDETGKKCRAFAEQSLSWSLIAQQHLTAYKELIS